MAEAKRRPRISLGRAGHGTEHAPRSLSRDTNMTASAQAIGLLPPHTSAALYGGCLRDDVYTACVETHLRGYDVCHVMHKHPDPSVHTRAPAHHGTPYAEPHTHVRAHAVRTRGVCAKPRRHAGAVRPCAHCITALTLQGSHLSAARHRVALSLYQSHDRDLRSMLEAEPARRRGHQCLHWSSPHRRWWCWWRWCRRRR